MHEFYAVRRDGHGESGRRDVYSHMSRSTLRSLASNGQHAGYSFNGYVVNGNSSSMAIRAALRRRDMGRDRNLQKMFN